MKIIRLSISNFKRIKAIALEPRGAVVQIRGRNGAGKSSCLDAIAALFGGEKLCPKEPVRRGTDGAVVRAELDGDFVAERRWTAEGKSSLTLRNKEGLAYDKPQRRLDELIGRLTFDPLAFMRLAPKDQAETLRALAGVDFAPLDGRRRQLYEDRTAANRQVAQLRARLAAAPQVEAPDAPVSSADLVAEHQRRSDQRTENERKRLDLEFLRKKYRQAGEEIERITTAIVDLQRQLESAQTICEELRVKGATLQDEVKALQDPDLEEIPRKLRDLEAVNERVRAKKAQAQLATDLERAEFEAKEFDGAIEAIDSQKAKLLAESKLTVEGLAFSEDGVTYRGLPLDQASQSEQLRISVAICAALNPKLRAMLVRDGSLLDEDSLALLQGEAERLELQVFLETVGRGDGEGIVIEDGQVEGAAPAEEAARG
jgi:chromosome segregation ATPase